MSVRIMAQIWPLPMHTTEKIILLKLADCASDDGRNAYPTVARIAAETGVCERTVQYTMRRLEERGFVTVQRPSGRYQATTYQLNMGAIVAPLPARMGASDDAMGATDDVHGCKAFAPDPSLTVIDPSDGRANAPRALFSDGDEPTTKPRHKPITEAWLAEQQALHPKLDIRLIYEQAQNRKTWAGYRDKRRALRDRIGWAQERAQAGQREPERVAVEVDDWQPRQEALHA